MRLYLYISIIPVMTLDRNHRIESTWFGNDPPLGCSLGVSSICIGWKGLRLTILANCRAQTDSDLLGRR